MPLLVVVMLLTYSDVGKISSRRHEFYEDAFGALWVKHDARKHGGYERQKYSGLDKQKFLRIITAFCASSYLAEEFVLRDNQVARHLRRAIELAEISVDQDELLKDLTVSTSLMIADGQTLRFVHRSFQEYFCALYIVGLSDYEIGSAVDAVSYRSETDSVIFFVHSINADKLEAHWLLPRLKSALAKMAPLSSNASRYAAIVKGDLALFLRQCRSLYEFQPDTGDIEAAFNAAHDMGLKREADLSRLFGPRGVVARDCRNFKQLFERLDAKHNRRLSGNHALFGNSIKPGALVPPRRK